MTVAEAVTPSVVPATTVATTPVATTPAVVTPAATPAVAAPIEYKFDPVEGAIPELDNSVIDVAKALNLPLEQAKALRDYELKSYKADMAAEEQAKAQMVADWDKQNASHPEFGGLKAQETDIKIGKLIAQFDKSGKIAEQVAKTPALLKEPVWRDFFARIAYAAGESSFIQGQTAHVDQRSVADRRYAKTTPG